MGKISLIFFLFCLLHFQTKAQEGFVVKTTGPYTLNFPNDLVITPDNTMLFLFTSVPPPPSTINTNEIRELNPSGETLNSYIFNDPTSHYVEMNHFLLVEDTLYVFGWGYLEEKSVNAFLIMHKLNLQLNLISSYKIDFEELYPYFVNHGTLHYIDGNFEYISSYGDSNEKFPFHAKISKNGELINFGIGGDPGKRLIPYDFSMNSDGEYQVFSVSGGYIGPFLLAGLICTHAKNFQIESYFQLPYEFISFFTHKTYNDSIYFLSGQWLDVTSSPPWRAGILKMKNDTIILDEFLYSTYPDTTACPAYRNSIEILSDGNILFCFTSNIEIQGIPQNQPTKINLMKITPDFEVIWHRYIGEPDVKYDAYVMNTTNDDEIVIHAAYSPAPNINNTDMGILFIKTNSEGIITGTNEDMQGVHSSEALLYPNPASDIVAIEFSMAYAAASLELRNINGQKVFATQLNANRQRVDISGIAPGTYVYRIFNKQGLDESGKLLVE